VLLMQVSNNINDEERMMVMMNENNDADEAK